MQQDSKIQSKGLQNILYRWGKWWYICGKWWWIQGTYQSHYQQEQGIELDNLYWIISCFNSGGLSDGYKLCEENQWIQEGWKEERCIGSWLQNFAWQSDQVIAIKTKTKGSNKTHLSDNQILWWGSRYFKIHFLIIYQVSPAALTATIAS